MKKWFEECYWSWKLALYYRFDEYNDNIDRAAFFEKLNDGWHEMYSNDERYQ